MQTAQLKKLQKQIAAKRAEMIKAGMELGLAHPTTVKISQELDELINAHLKASSKDS